MRYDCPNCWGTNVVRIENQKDTAYCEDCHTWYHLLTGEVIYDKKSNY